MTARAAAPRAAIVGIAGPALSAAERALFAAMPPAGFILFKRNCESPAQLGALTASLKALFFDRHVPILVDQEGGRVQRLAPPHWPALPPARAIGRLAERDSAAGEQAARLHATAIAGMLRAAGIDTVCAPCLDLLRPEATAAIGARAYAADPALVARLGRIAAETFLAHGIAPVIKHLPGHGRATCDSHLALPTVTAGRDLLEATDFAAFRPLADLPLAMTAHIVFTAIDPDLPATLSPRVIQTAIREAIGFRGLLLSDDLSMQALSGAIARRATAALAAGCDLALHCNGDLAELEAVLAAVPALDEARWAMLQGLGTAAMSPVAPAAPIEDILADLSLMLGDGEVMRG